MKIRTLTIAISLMMSSAPLAVYATEGNCEAVSLSTNKGGYINGFSFPTLSNLAAGEVFTSQCVTVEDGHPDILFEPQGNVLAAINGGQFSSAPFSLPSGTQLQIKARAPKTVGLQTIYRIIGQLPDSLETTQKRVYVNQVVSSSDTTVPVDIPVDSSEGATSENNNSCEIVDLSLSVQGQELEPILEGAPGSIVTSECITFINVPSSTFVEPHRRETLVINGTQETNDTTEVHENMSVALRDKVSTISGDANNFRFKLSYFDDKSAKQEVYYRWRVITENELAGQSCTMITGQTDVNIPYSIESEGIPTVDSMCISVSESGLLSLSQSGVQVSVNGEIINTNSVNVEANDQLVLQQIQDKNSRTFLYNGVFQTDADQETNLTWITVNSENVNSNTPSEPAQKEQPTSPLLLTVDPNYFSDCRPLDLYIRGNGKRSQVGTVLSSTLEIEPGVATASECIEFGGMETDAVLTSVKGSWFSVNGAPFTQEDTEISNGDRVVLAYNTPHTHGLSTTERVKAVFPDLAENTSPLYLKWGVQTSNTGRAPREWHIHPEGEYKQVEDIASQLVAGDIVNIAGNYEYKPFILEGISGTKTNPIIFRGTSVNGKRPTFKGNHTRWPWTIGVRSSHNIRFENIEITGADTICFRHESNNIVLENIYLHDCKVHGILGTDSSSGSLTINQSEITRTGGKYEGRPWGHAVYVATDQYMFPNSTLKITHSFLHGNKGNTVKSRAERLELYYNWIEVNDLEQARYAVELIGPVVVTRHPIEQDVTGNLFWLGKDSYAIRAGDDGTGGSNGIVRFTNNTVIHAAESDHYSFMRLDHKMTAVGVQNNIFIKKSPNAFYTIIRDNVKKESWGTGTEAIFISNNILPQDSYLNTTNHSQRRLLIKDYLSEAAYKGNSEQNRFDGINVNYSDMSLYVNQNSELLRLGNPGSAFNGEFLFSSPLKYLDVSYKAPNQRPIENSPILKVTKDYSATTGAL
ncbi:right-handed parallel beta-helix repeat-containing protein [Aestuariibacter sp. A3R04]|uniref:right-handed parallel beta-helix repeat-containing protein n=1 Tax=Aestuariibacter sp. A3R04 TaxID=2841571 RepID=UPI001C0A5006|nr:right-handed parallel beta-helix repeat-containing protein [Aestuariibacter sp. A3R04]MBU3021754.1 right-handed parallel beta-helix repeat-containing protein [Aestuariibacter sp. A3R04]